MILNLLYIVDEILYQFCDVGVIFIIIILLFVDKVKQGVLNVGINIVYVVGEVENCELFLFLFEDEGEDFLENVEINVREDVVCLLYLSGIIGFLKGVMFIYYNLIVEVLIVIYDSFMLNNDELVVFGLLFFFYIFG